MLTLSVVVEGQNFPRIVVSRADLDLTPEAMLRVVRDALKRRSVPSESVALLVKTMWDMPGKAAMTNVGTGYVESDVTIYAEFVDYVEGAEYWDFTIHTA